MRKSLLFVTFMLALAACKDKSATSPSIDFGAGDGFSYRDGNNLPVGSQDPTDWTSDSNWNEQELMLFSELSLTLNGAQQTGTIEFAYLYPNPARISTWGFTSRQTATGERPDFMVAAVLVGADYQVIQRLPHTSSTKGYFAASFDYAKLSMQPNTRYRLYYVLYNNTNGLLYKGHGDIRYQQ